MAAHVSLHEHLTRADLAGEERLARASRRGFVTGERHIQQLALDKEAAKGAAQPGWWAWARRNWVLLVAAGALLCVAVAAAIAAVVWAVEEDQCPSGQVRFNGQCRECSNDSHCGIVGVCNPATHSCQQCTSDAQCQLSLPSSYVGPPVKVDRRVCHQADSQADSSSGGVGTPSAVCTAQCTSNAECAAVVPTLPFCLSGTCVACTQSSECPAAQGQPNPTCSATSHQCVQCGAAPADPSCSEGFQCVKGVCVAGCSSSGDCAAPQVCVQGGCQVCDPLDDAGCAGSTPACVSLAADGAVFRYGACTGVGDCDSGGTCTNKVCEYRQGSSLCVGCRSSADCAGNQVCRAHACSALTVRDDPRMQISLLVAGTGRFMTVGGSADAPWVRAAAGSAAASWWSFVANKSSAGTFALLTTSPATGPVALNFDVVGPAVTVVSVPGNAQPTSFPFSLRMDSASSTPVAAVPAGAALSLFLTAGTGQTFYLGSDASTGAITAALTPGPAWIGTAQAGGHVSHFAAATTRLQSDDNHALGLTPTGSAWTASTCDPAAVTSSDGACASTGGVWSVQQSPTSPGAFALLAATAATIVQLVPDTSSGALTASPLPGPGSDNLSVAAPAPVASYPWSARVPGDSDTLASYPSLEMEFQLVATGSDLGLTLASGTLTSASLASLTSTPSTLTSSTWVFGAPLSAPVQMSVKASGPAVTLVLDPATGALATTTSATDTDRSFVYVQPSIHGNGSASLMWPAVAVGNTAPTAFVAAITADKPADKLTASAAGLGSAPAPQITLLNGDTGAAVLGTGTPGGASAATLALGVLGEPGKTLSTLLVVGARWTAWQWARIV